MKTVDTGTRIGTMVFDHFTMTFIVMVLVAPGLVNDFMYAIGNPDAPPKLFLGNYYLNIVGFSLYFNKDIIMGRSIAKRTLKLQVVNNKTGQPANPLKCLVRNLTILIWPIEVIVALLNNERRIGDFIAGTRLTAYKSDEHNGKVNWALVLLALTISILFTYLVLVYPFEWLFERNGIMFGFPL